MAVGQLVVIALVSFQLFWLLTDQHIPSTSSPGLESNTTAIKHPTANKISKIAAAYLTISIPYLLLSSMAGMALKFHQLIKRSIVALRSSSVAVELRLCCVTIKSAAFKANTKLLQRLQAIIFSYFSVENSGDGLAKFV